MVKICKEYMERAAFDKLSKRGDEALARTNKMEERSRTKWGRFVNWFNSSKPWGRYGH